MQQEQKKMRARRRRPREEAEAEAEAEVEVEEERGGGEEEKETLVQSVPSPRPRVNKGSLWSGFSKRAWVGFKGVLRAIFSYDGPPNARAWLALSVSFFFLIMTMGRLFTRHAVATEEADKMPYTKGPKGVAFVDATSAAFEDLFVGTERFSVRYWENTSLPKSNLSPDILSGLKSCDLSRRLGKPCTNAHVNFAGSELVGSILYYGPSSSLVTKGSCWQAPHRKYSAVVGNVTIKGDGGTLRVTYENFRDQYRNGAADFVISDTFCATMSGIPYATNFWDDAKGDVFGCSAQMHKGPGFIPIQCRVGTTDAVSTEQVTYLNLLKMCFDVNDLARLYDGSNTLLRCYEDEAVNACGGREPDKKPVTNVVRVLERQISHTVLRVANNTISLIQWLPPKWLLQRHMLLSDCVVLQPLCNTGEPICAYPTLKQYLMAGGTSCSAAFFIEREFFYVVPATAESLQTDMIWYSDDLDMSVAVVSFVARPPASACQLYNNASSVGSFVIINPLHGLESQRTLASFAVVYGAVDTVIMNTNHTLLPGGVCAKVKVSFPDFPESVDYALAGMRIWQTSSVTADPDTGDTGESPSSQCASRHLTNLPTRLYTPELCQALSDQTVFCDVVDGCTRVVPFDGSNVDDCMCCIHVVRRVSTSNTTSDTNVGFLPCERCPEDETVVAEPVAAGITACKCIDVVQTMETRWIFTPYTAKGTVFENHGRCVATNVTFDNFRSLFAANPGRIHDSLYDCIRHHNNCAKGYTLYPIDQADTRQARVFGCFIDKPFFIGGAMEDCHAGSGSCKAPKGSAGLSWYAHCSGGCLAGQTCRCWAEIASGMTVDGGSAAVWGARYDWWNMDPTTAMGNHYIPHYICIFPDNDSSKIPSWMGALSCLGPMCSWRVTPNGAEAIWDKYCGSRDNGPIIPVSFAPISLPPSPPST